MGFLILERYKCDGFWFNIVLFYCIFFLEKKPFLDLIKNNKRRGGGFESRCPYERLQNYTYFLISRQAGFGFSAFLIKKIKKNCLNFSLIFYMPIESITTVISSIIVRAYSHQTKSLLGIWKQ